MTQRSPFEIPLTAADGDPTVEAWAAEVSGALFANRTLNSGDTLPTDTDPHMVAMQTAASADSVLYARNKADDAWARMGILDETRDVFLPGALANASFSDDAAFSLVVPSGIRAVRVYLNKIIPATTGGYLIIRYSDDGGSTYENGTGFYRTTFRQINETGFAQAVGGSDETAGILIPTINSSAAGGFAVVDIIGLNSGLCYGSSRYFVAGATSNFNGDRDFRNASGSGPFDAFQILMTAGNITSGDIVVQAVG